MWRAAAVLLALAATGCFEADAPLGPPGRSALDPAVLGAWDCVPGEPGSDERAAMRVMRFDGARYAIHWQEDGRSTHYRAHPTEVGKRTLVNADEIDAGPPKEAWVFLRYERTADGTLRIWVVDGDAIGTKKSEEGRRILRRRVMDDAIYRLFAVCTPG